MLSLSFNNSETKHATKNLTAEYTVILIVGDHTYR